MNFFNILQAEFLKTKRSVVRRIAIAGPLCLAILATIQQGYFSINLFNWFYVVFLPVIFSVISVAAVNIDNGKQALRTIKALPLSQKKIWWAKLVNILVYALSSCLLLGVAVIIIPLIFHLLNINQLKPLNVDTALAGILVMFLSSAWQIPLSFILAKKISSPFIILINCFLSAVGVLSALKFYWFLYPWSWVNRCMIVMINVLPNGLPNENIIQIGYSDVISTLTLSLILTLVLSFISVSLFANAEAR